MHAEAVQKARRFADERSEYEAEIKVRFIGSIFALHAASHWCVLQMILDDRETAHQEARQLQRSFQDKEKELQTELVEAQVRLEELADGAANSGSDVDVAYVVLVIDASVATLSSVIWRRYYDNLVEVNRRKWQQSEQQEILQVQKAAQDTFVLV